MMHVKFPDPRKASPEGIVAFGGNLEPETLIAAYRAGIFPWTIEGLPLPWFCPAERAILRFCNLHIPRRLARERRKTSFRFSINTAFRQVISACAALPRPEEDGTWITDEMIDAYTRLHDLGFAHSVEVWDKNELVGGLYGIAVDGAFAGESMFHTRTNSSKFALLFLIEKLQASGFEWIDIQVMTAHLEALGAELITRDEFLNLLARTHAKWNDGRNLRSEI